MHKAARKFHQDFCTLAAIPIFVLILVTIVGMGAGCSEKDENGDLPDPYDPAYNTPPVAFAGFEQEVEPGETVYLSSKGSHDPDGKIVSFAWQQIHGSHVNLTNRNTSEPHFNITEKHPLEVLVFELSVTDNKGATDSDRVNIHVMELSSAPDAPVLVSSNSMGNDQAELIWLPGSDSEDIIYTVHLSSSPDFIPGGHTTCLQNKAINSAELSGLEPDTQYFARIQAHVPGSHRSFSNELTFRTGENRTQIREDSSYRVLGAPGDLPGDENDSDSFSPVIDGSNLSWTLGPDEEAPAPGEILIAWDMEQPLFRKVVSTSVSGNEITAVTEPAVMSELFEDLSYSSGTKLINPARQVFKKSVPGNSHPIRIHGETESGLLWADNNFMILGKNSMPDGEPVGDNYKSDENNEQVIINRELQMRGDRNAFGRPGERLSVNISASVSDPDYEISSLSLVRVRWPGNTGPVFGTGRGTYRIVRNDSANRKEIEFQWEPTMEQADPRGKPYTLVFTATARQRHNCGWFMGCRSRTSRMEIPVYVAFDEPVPENSSFRAISSTGMDFNGNVRLNFEPEIYAEAFIQGGRLQTAEINATAFAGIDIEAFAKASGNASASRTSELFRRRFVKVIPAGSIPIVITGELAVEGRFNATANADIDVRQDFHYHLDLEAGARFNRHTGWQPYASASPDYRFTITGEAGATVDVEVRLIPKIRISLYEVATGHMGVEPYLFSETALNGRIDYMYDPLVSAFDAAYRFTKLDVGGGIDFYMRADLSVLDYTIAGWPSRNADDFYRTSIIDRTVIYGLPRLSLHSPSPGFFEARIRDETLLQRNGFVLNSGEWVVYPNSGDIFTVSKYPGEWSGTQSNALQPAWMCVNATETDYNKYLSDYEFTVRFAGHAELGSWLSMYEDLRNIRLPRCDDRFIPDSE